MFKPPKIILNERNLRWSADEKTVPSLVKREPSLPTSEQAETEMEVVYDSDTISTRDS
jgi:hypothetical protein